MPAHIGALGMRGLLGSAGPSTALKERLQGAGAGARSLACPISPAPFSSLLARLWPCPIPRRAAFVPAALQGCRAPGVVPVARRGRPARIPAPPGRPCSVQTLCRAPCAARRVPAVPCAPCRARTPRQPPRWGRLSPLHLLRAGTPPLLRHLCQRVSKELDVPRSASEPPHSPWPFPALATAPLPAWSHWHAVAAAEPGAGACLHPSIHPSAHLSPRGR